MTNLTESMTGLRNEILAMRENREALRTELRRIVSSRRADVLAFRATLIDDLAGARKAWTGVAHEVHAQASAKAKTAPVAAKPVPTPEPVPEPHVVERHAGEAHVNKTHMAKPEAETPGSPTVVKSVAAESHVSHKPSPVEAPRHAAAPATTHMDHPAAQQHGSGGHSEGKRNRDRHA